MANSHFIEEQQAQQQVRQLAPRGLKSCACQQVLRGELRAARARKIPVLGCSGSRSLTALLFARCTCIFCTAAEFLNPCALYGRQTTCSGSCSTLSFNSTRVVEVLRGAGTSLREENPFLLRSFLWLKNELMFAVVCVHLHRNGLGAGARAASFSCLCQHEKCEKAQPEHGPLNRRLLGGGKPKTPDPRRRRGFPRSFT